MIFFSNFEPFLDLEAFSIEMSVSHERRALNPADERHLTRRGSARVPGAQKEMSSWLGLGMIGCKIEGLGCRYYVWTY